MIRTGWTSLAFARDIFPTQSIKGSGFRIPALQGMWLKVSLCSLLMFQLQLLYIYQILRQAKTTAIVSQRPGSMRNYVDLRLILLLLIYGLEYPPYFMLRVNVILPNRSIMPRNFHRKYRRHHLPPSNDHAIQLLSGRNQAQHNRGIWCKSDSAETFPRLGQHIVSSSITESVSLRQKGQSTRFSPSCHGQCTLVDSGLRDSNLMEKEVRGSQSNPQLVTLSRSEIKEYLWLALEEGKRRMDEWITSEWEQAAEAKRGSAASDLCVMDWQPERTVIIPQLVDIRYPWDAGEDTKWERWGRWTTKRDAPGWML